MTNDPPPPRAFAYRIPLNVYAPVDGEWSTLVRGDRVRVGDRLELAWTEATGDLQTMRGSPHKWEVVAIHPTGDEGRRARVGGKGRPAAIWDGSLVLRRVGPTA